MKRKELDHFGLDRRYPLITGYTDAVVTILDVVRIPNLVQIDCRQVYPAVERPIHPLPPLRKARLRGHEAAIEGLVAIHAADYLRDLYVPKAQTMPIVPQVPLPDLVEGQKPSAFTPQTGRDAPEEGPTPGTVEVRLGLYLNAYETDHRSPPSCHQNVVDKSPQEYGRTRTRSFLIDEEKEDSS
jgi:hypothetical protein